MNWDRVLETVTACIWVIAFLGGASFLVCYARFDWRSHPWGRNVMAFIAMIELILGLSLARWFFGDYPGRRIILALAATAYAVVIWHRFSLLIRRPKRTRPEATSGGARSAPVDGGVHER
jgi:hypothetical protein